MVTGGGSCLYAQDASQTDLALATWGGELHLPHCIVSVISETDMECVYDNQT